MDSSYDNGVIYCKIRREARSNVNGVHFDLINNKYHLLVASGKSLNGTFFCTVFFSSDSILIIQQLTN